MAKSNVQNLPGADHLELKTNCMVITFGVLKFDFGVRNQEIHSKFPI